MEGLVPSPRKSPHLPLPYAVSSFKASRACQVIIPYLGIGKAGLLFLVTRVSCCSSQSDTAFAGVARTKGLSARAH